MVKINIEDYMPKYVKLKEQNRLVTEAYTMLHNFITDPDQFMKLLMAEESPYIKFGDLSIDRQEKFENIRLGLLGVYTRNQAVQFGRNAFKSILNTLLNTVGNDYSSIKDNVVGPTIIIKDNFGVIAEQNLFVANFIERKDNYTSSDAYKEYFINGMTDISVDLEHIDIKDPVNILHNLNNLLDKLNVDIESVEKTLPERLTNFLDYYSERLKLVMPTLVSEQPLTEKDLFEEPKYEEFPFTNINDLLNSIKENVESNSENIIPLLDSIYGKLIKYLDEIVELKDYLIKVVLELPNKTYDIDLVTDSYRKIIDDFVDDKITGNEVASKRLKHTVTIDNILTLDQHLLTVVLGSGNIINYHLNNYVEIYNLLNVLTAKAVLKPVTKEEKTENE